MKLTCYPVTQRAVAGWTVFVVSFAGYVGLHLQFSKGVTAMKTDQLGPWHIE